MITTGSIFSAITGLFFFSSPLWSQIAFTTSCEVKNGKAYGFVHNHQDGFEIDGEVWFFFFDCKGELIEMEQEYEYEYVSAKKTEEIEKTSAPKDACTCTFNVDKAIEETNTIVNTYPAPTDPLKDVTYVTSCELKDGTAYGFVHNYQGSFEIDGKVWFYFYDKEGHILDDEEEYEYEYVSAESTEEIEKTFAPRGACSCKFEVQDAIK